MISVFVFLSILLNIELSFWEKDSFIITSSHLYLLFNTLSNIDLTGINEDDFQLTIKDGVASKMLSQPSEVVTHLGIPVTHNGIVVTHLKY